MWWLELVANRGVKRGPCSWSKSFYCALFTNLSESTENENPHILFTIYYVLVIVERASAKDKQIKDLEVSPSEFWKGSKTKEVFTQSVSTYATAEWHGKVPALNVLHFSSMKDVGCTVLFQIVQCKDRDRDCSQVIAYLMHSVPFLK